MSNTAGDLDSAIRALDHTTWFLSRQLTGKRNERRFKWKVENGKGFILDENEAEVGGSRKPIAKWIEIGRQLRLAEAAIWLKVGQYPKPSQEPDESKRVSFWWSFDGIRRVFVFEATCGGQKLSNKEIDKRYKLHRRLWLLASQGEAVEQLYLNVTNRLADRKQVSQPLLRVGEQLGLVKRKSTEDACVAHSSVKRSLAYSD